MKDIKIMKVSIRFKSPVNFMLHALHGEPELDPENETVMINDIWYYFDARAEKKQPWRFTLRSPFGLEALDRRLRRAVFICCDPSP